jgi:hypothetical protein
LKPFLYYKGFHALQWHRIGHWLWRDGRPSVVAKASKQALIRELPDQRCHFGLSATTERDRGFADSLLERSGFAP